MDDFSVVGEKAFNWHEAFPTVFERGGFDVIIGNPPYVDIKALSTSHVQFFFKNYTTANNRINLFSLFIERALTLLKITGKFSFIIPSSLLIQDSYKLIRHELLLKTEINSIVRLPNESFGGTAGEVKVDTIIFTSTLSLKSHSLVEIIIYKGFDRINEISNSNCDEHIYLDQVQWIDDVDWIFRINVNNKISVLISKIEKGTTELSNCADFCLGLTPYDKYKGHTPVQIKNRAFHATEKINETYKKLLAGNDVRRYYVEWSGLEWISYGNWLGAPRESRFFKEKRLLVKQIIDWSDKRIWVAMTSEELYNTQNAFNLIPKENFQAEYILVLLNSKLISFYHKKKFLEEYKDRFQKILIKDCKRIPVKINMEVQEPFKEKADLMIQLNKDLNDAIKKFQRTIKRKFERQEFSGKIREYYLLSYEEFIKELSKNNVTLSLSEEAEWEEYFMQESRMALEIKAKMDYVDKEIDQMVYKLYELTEEEIQIVEGANIQV